MSLQVANQTFHTDRPDLPECFQLSVLSWLPCIYLWVVCPIYIFYLKRSNRDYIMMSIMNRIKTVRLDFIVVYFITVYSKSKVRLIHLFDVVHSALSTCVYEYSWLFSTSLAATKPVIFGSVKLNLEFSSLKIIMMLPAAMHDL